jgi:4-diphosphocytidyl-2-C-methyl-D-erythritol kinase
MQNQSRKLGTDCAFFIANKPVLAFNKGDEFKNVHVDLTDYRIVICKPDIHIDTTKAYSWIKPEKKHTSPGDVVSMPVSEWKGNLVNDFEEEVFIRYPEISQIRSILYDSGALYASLTGSGATVYGIFKPETHFNPDCITGFYWQGI